MKPQENPLLDAIDKLTRTHTSRVMQANDAGITCMSEVAHAGLIPQLRDAIASNLGGSAGGKAPRERIPLDADALTKYEQMEESIGQRYRDLVGAIPGLYPEENLRDWYRAFDNERRKGAVTEDEYNTEVSTMETWVRIVEEKLAPPTKRELTGQDCPECGFAWYDTVLNVAKAGKHWADVERQAALTVTYRPDTHGGLMASFAKCGCCNHVWMGSAGIRALAYELEHPSDTREREDAQPSAIA